MCEMCLLICFPDSEWWTEWHCRVSVLRAAKWGHIPETQWHLLRCKMLLLFPFMALDLLFGGHKASNRSLTISRGRKKGEKAKRWQHMTILLNIPWNEMLKGIWLYSFFKYCIYAKEGLTDAILNSLFLYFTNSFLLQQQEQPQFPFLLCVLHYYFMCLICENLEEAGKQQSHN